MSHDDIRAALEAATRQPWVLLYPGQCCEGYCIESEDGRDAVAHGLEGSVSDLDLITSAPTWLAELLAEVDALTARAEAAEQTIQRVRAIHYAADNDLARTPVCSNCEGRAGVHDCGCWADEDRQPVCGHCNEGWKGASVPWPCETIRALDGGAS